jgi:hypothetical protein
LTDTDDEKFQKDAMQLEIIQLKQMLYAEDKHVQQLSSSLLEERNTSSDMKLLHEECHQLKLILSSQTQEIEKLKSELLKAQNDLSNMDLLQEECKQLKVMLMENQSNSLVLDIKSKLELHVTLCLHLQACLTELKNDTSDMHLLHEENAQLKNMLHQQTNIASKADISPLFAEENSRMKLELAECKLRETQLTEKVNQLEQTIHQLKLGSSENGNNDERYNNVVVQYNTLVKHYHALKALHNDKESKLKVFDETVREKDELIDKLKQDIGNLNEECVASSSHIQNLSILQQEYRSSQEKSNELETKVKL